MKVILIKEGRFFMGLLPGVFVATKKDGTTYYRSSITYKNKHISLGSYDTAPEASDAYEEAGKLLNTSSITINHHSLKMHLPFEKWVSLINFRDNGIYCKTPIYITTSYFLYYFNKEEHLKFDVDDLFYYSKHKIQRRGGHLFVAEYGMQVNILARYGIKNFAVEGRDYRFVNGDTSDFRYRNIEIINKYHGVFQIQKKGVFTYLVKIHINGDYLVGTYNTEVEAAVAYNKAATLLQEQGVKKNFPKNYVIELNEIEYASLYNKVAISKKIRNYKKVDKSTSTPLTPHS